MRAMCLMLGVSMLTGTATAADLAPAKPIFRGTWEGEGIRLVIEQARHSSIRVMEVKGTVKREFTCPTNGKECDYSDAGRPSKMSVYYNGPKLVAFERIGADAEVVLKRVYSLAEDGNALNVETTQLVPPREKPEQCTLQKQP